MKAQFKTLGVVALSVALVLGATIPAQAAGGSGYRSCSAPKEVALYSDQLGAGWHYYSATNKKIYTTQPSYQRGQFNTFGATTATNWTIYAPATFSYGSTCF